MNDTIESENSEIMESSYSSMKRSISATVLSQSPSNVNFDEPSYVKTFLRFKPDATIENQTYTLVNPTTLLAKFPLGDVNKMKKMKSKFCVSPTISKKITFTKIFAQEVTQQTIFEQTVKSDVKNFLSGKNCTVMTYGTTNSGKTYTLFGTNSKPGIVSKCVDTIFSSVKCVDVPHFKPSYVNDIEVLPKNEGAEEKEYKENSSNTRTDFTTEVNARNLAEQEIGASRTMHSIWISFFEIYNDVVYDLLAGDDDRKCTRLKLVTDKEGKTFPNSLKAVHVTTSTKAHRILEEGLGKLILAATSLNANSSRSHVVFSVKLLTYFEGCTSKDVQVSLE